MEEHKSHTLLYFMASVGMIMLAIAFTSILDQAKTRQNGSDIRAKAGATSTLQFTGVVNGTNDEALLVVDDMHFANNPERNLGTWTITQLPSASVRAFPPGTKVTITADAKTVSIPNRTLTATGIR